MINRKVMYTTALSFTFLIAVALISISLISIQKYTALSQPQNTTAAPSFSFNNHTYRFTYVASNLSEQQTGLMNITITSNTFELFVFPSAGIYPFWMKNTYSPLDIIWINGSTVTYIANATPCSWYSANQAACIVYNNYTEGHMADYVIETLLGFANRTGLKVGDKISISNP